MFIERKEECSPSLCLPAPALNGSCDGAERCEGNDQRSERGGKKEERS